jgi:hypothetical protein
MSVTELLARIIARVALLDPLDHPEAESSAFESSIDQISGHGGLIGGFILAAIVTAPIWVPLLVLRSLWRRLSNR